MRNKKILIIFLLLVVGAVIAWQKVKKPAENGDVTREVKPIIGSIENSISVTGSVLPKNRLEVKPPVNGRIEEVLVKESDHVTVGQTLAWMSSTERAALLDAARGQGKEALEYWQGVYKAIPLISSIEGEVIVAKTQPGQTVTTDEAVVVLSDRLIVRAQVDETDIGKVKTGQRATVILDAYPDQKIEASVDHVYYESKTVNNVTIYEVDLIPDTVPAFFRSGMNATVMFIENTKSNCLLIPLEAVQKDKDKAYVLLRSKDKEPVRADVKTGLSDEKNIEILSGLNANDMVVYKTKQYALPKNNTGTNPFMPSRNRNQSRQSR